MPTFKVAQFLVLLLGAVSAQDCVSEGELRATEQWYEDILSATYNSKSTLEFTFTILYSQKVAYENPIQLLLYKQDSELKWNTTTACEEKVETVKASPHGNVITLNQEDKFSGCVKNGTLLLECFGKKVFKLDDGESSKYVVSLARCTSATIQMAYGFTLSGYSSQCTGRIVPVPTTNPAPTRSPPDSTPVDSSQLMTLTVLASINLSILLINSICLVCSKFHIADRIMGNSDSMKMTRLTEQ